MKPLFVRESDGTMTCQDGRCPAPVTKSAEPVRICDAVKLAKTATPPPAVRVKFADGTVQILKRGPRETDRDWVRVIQRANELRKKPVKKARVQKSLEDVKTSEELAEMALEELRAGNRRLAKAIERAQTGEIDTMTLGAPDDSLDRLAYRDAARRHPGLEKAVENRRREDALRKGWSWRADLDGAGGVTVSGTFDDDDDDDAPPATSDFQPISSMPMSLQLSKAETALAPTVADRSSVTHNGLFRGSTAGDASMASAIAQLARNNTSGVQPNFVIARQKREQAAATAKALEAQLRERGR